MGEASRPNRPHAVDRRNGAVNMLIRKIKARHGGAV